MKFNKLLKESQFHGGTRLAERRCRWLWSIAMILLLGSAVTVVCVTVMRYNQNPTFMVQLEVVESSIEFPSVIVCPEILFSEDNIDRFLASVFKMYFHNLTPDSIRFKKCVFYEIPENLNRTYLKENLNVLAAFWSPDLLYHTYDLKNMEHLLAYNNMDVDTAGRLLTTSCESTLIRCRWQSSFVNCSDLFHMELTGDGYCCVFNGRSLKRELDNVNRVGEYQKWYVNGFGHETGLMLAVNQSQVLNDVDLTYKWLALQSSQHYVESTINGTALNPASENWVEYHIQNFQIAEDARSLSHQLRKCRMAYDPLTLFPIYHKKYCVVECEIAQTINRCNCIRMVHPPQKGVPYCNASRMLCAKRAMVSYDSEACDCPAACDVATDYVKITNFGLSRDVQPIDTFYDGLDFKTVTVVRTFLLNKKVRTKSRWSCFTNIDLFSQLGGVFNVFFGCSILTLLELVVLACRGIKPFIPINKIRAEIAKVRSQRKQTPAKKDNKLKHGRVEKRKAQFNTDRHLR